MKEITNHPAYKLIKKDCDKGIALDYVILQNDNNDKDTIKNHKIAAITAMKIIAKRNECFDIKYDESKMELQEYDCNQFFSIPTDPYYNKKIDEKNRAWSTNQNAEYAYAFLEPPYGDKCILKDWENLNEILFSNKENLHIYKWSTNWSNYFEAGLEWWGAFYWTIYDKEYDRFIVVGASTTD